MKKGEHMSEEHKAKFRQGQAAAVERRRAEKAEADAKKAEHPEVVAKVDAGKVAIPAGAIDGGAGAVNIGPVTALAANGHAGLLDIHDPLKWQMKVRMFLTDLEPEAAEHWMEGIRLVCEMAGNLVCSCVYQRVTNRFYVCNRPFTDGKPAGEAGYYDADRVFIKVYCCENAHYNDMLKLCMEKERAIAAWVEKSEKAARQAESDARSAARRTMPA